MREKREQLTPIVPEKTQVSLCPNFIPSIFQVNYIEISGWVAGNNPSIPMQRSRAVFENREKRKLSGSLLLIPSHKSYWMSLDLNLSGNFKIIYIEDRASKILYNSDLLRSYIFKRCF